MFGSGNVGIMGTGNFNVALAKQQNPDIELGVTLLPGLETGQTASFAGGDIVTVPKGSERVEDAVEFMKFILSDQVQTERVHGSWATCPPAATSSPSTTIRTSPTRSRHCRSPRRRTRRCSSR